MRPGWEQSWVGWDGALAALQSLDITSLMLRGVARPRQCRACSGCEPHSLACNPRRGLGSFASAACRVFELGACADMSIGADGARAVATALQREGCKLELLDLRSEHGPLLSLDLIG